jgi:glycosyltransferase involved in cell wall biosynthesis
MPAKKRLHILLIHQSFVSLNEAGGTRHAEFSDHLSAQGHRVTVITSSLSYLTGKTRIHQQVPKNNPKVIYVNTSGNLHRSFFQRLLKFTSFTWNSFFAAMRVGRIDIVWGTSPPIFQAASAWTAARVKRAPFLLEIRDLWPAFPIALGILRGSLLISATRWLESFLYRAADLIVINSPGFRNHIKARGGGRIKVVPNGSDPGMFKPAAKGADFRHAHNLQDKFVVLYAGAHGAANGLSTVLDAANLLKDQSQIAFVLIGDGKDKPLLTQRAAELNLNNLHMLSPLPKEQIAEALAAADACLAILQPIELFKTVYPNKVFDYMAAGRPVLLAVDGVIRRVVEGAGAGVFVPPGNPEALETAIRKMAANPIASKRMGAAGRNHLEQYFNRPILALKMQAVLEETARMHS